MSGPRVRTAEPPLSDEELAELALAADPNAEVGDDAIALGELLRMEAGTGGYNLLPEWYMPPPMGASRLLQGWRRRIVMLIIASFLLINAYGLCSTYGRVGFG